MSCQRYRNAIVALARSVDESQDLERARAHLAICATCRRVLDEQRALTAGLRALAEAARADEPSDALGHRLEAMFEKARLGASVPTSNAPASAGRGLWLRWWPAAAAATLAAGAAAWILMSGPPRKPELPSAAPAAGIIELVGFQPLPQAVALPGFDNGEIVRTEIAVTALPIYGVGIPPDAATAAVKVDFLVGQDGHPRMIRLVREESRDSRSR